MTNCQQSRPEGFGRVTVRPGKSPLAAAGQSPIVYKAVADEVDGEVEVKRVDVSGVPQGDTLTLRVVPI